MTEEIETEINSISKAFNANAEEIIQTNSSKPARIFFFIQKDSSSGTKI